MICHVGFYKVSLPQGLKSSVCRFQGPAAPKAASKERERELGGEAGGFDGFDGT